MKCECPDVGILQPIMRSWYDPETELPFVNHEPGKCQCTKDIKPYLRNGKVLNLCSCCYLSSDTPVATKKESNESKQ